MLDWSGPVEVECECGSVTFVSLLFLVLKLRGEFELFSLSSLRLCWEWKGVGHGREVGNEWVDIYQYTHPGEYLTGQPQTTDIVARVADNGLDSEYKPYGYGALTSDAMLNMNLTTPAGVDESPVSRSIRSLTKSAAEGAYYIQGPGSKYLRESLSAADRGEEEYTREPMTNESTWPTLPEVVYDFSNLEGIGEVRGWMTKTELVQLEVAHPTLPTQYWGTAKERKEQVALYAEFSSFFRTELTREPADITPMRINIDADK